MPTLTPQHRSDEAAWAAVRDGVISGLCGLVPSSLGVWVAMKNPRFVRATNWQSRTALVIMPPLFMFGYASEHKLQHKMQEIASEAEHSKGVTEWAERHHEQQRKEMKERMLLSSEQLNDIDTERQLTELYRKGVENSGVRIVPGDRLGPHHQLANFWQENPFKILAGLGVPTVLYIFHGRQGQQHLQLQSKLMHTRVFGQFAVISMLLGLMGFKEYMDKNGKFITELEAENRVLEMQRVREEILEKVMHEKKLKEEREATLKKAHEEDEKEGNVGRAESEVNKAKRRKKKLVKHMEEITA